jgi:cell division protein FtsL
MNRPTPSAIRRNLDRRGLATFVAATFSCALLGGAALMHAWVRTRVTEQGYRLSRLSVEYRELSREHQSLQLKAAELKSPQRIEELSRTRLSMGPPSLDRVVVLVGEDPGSAQRRAEAAGRSNGDPMRSSLMTAAR